METQVFGTEPLTDRAQALAARGLTKRFGATLALDDAHLVVRPGTVHALLGGNGSGKSTTVKVLAGVHHADAGILEVAGQQHDLQGFGPAEARAAGLRFVHQDLGLFDELSVAENFALDAGYPTGGGRIHWRALHRRVRAILDDYELDVDPATPITALRPADRTMVAIARALQDQTGSELVLVLDEPTATLAQHESELLLTRIRRRAELGQTVLIVSHRMSEVLSVAQDYTVFRDGRVVAALVDATPTEDELVALMAGGQVGALRHIGTAYAGSEMCLTVRGLVAGPLRGVDLDVAAGEVLGLAGLVGSGRSTVLRVLFGCISPEAATMTLEGTPFAPGSVGAAMDRGVALVPEDRAREAAFADLSLVDNLSVTVLNDYWSLRGMNRSSERSIAARLLQRLTVRAAGPDAPFGSLSGGNQQKVVLARWLQRSPRLLLLDEPTQGVDVMSRVDIYRQVREAAAAGATVIVASSDPSELVALCDRIAVLSDGRVAEVLDVEGLDPDVLTTTMLRSGSTPLEAS